MSVDRGGMVLSAELSISLPRYPGGQVSMSRRVESPVSLATMSPSSSITSRTVNWPGEMVMSSQQATPGESSRTTSRPVALGSPWMFATFTGKIAGHARRTFPGPVRASKAPR